MREDQKKDVALFRYSIISELVNAKDLGWGEQERLIREKSSRKWAIPHSEKTSIGRTCILNWGSRPIKRAMVISAHCILVTEVTRVKAGPWMKTHALVC